LRRYTKAEKIAFFAEKDAADLKRSKASKVGWCKRKTVLKASRPFHIFHNRSTTVPQPFHNRSTTVPRPFHDGSTIVPRS